MRRLVRVNHILVGMRTLIQSGSKANSDPVLRFLPELRNYNSYILVTRSPELLLGTLDTADD